MAQVDWDDEKVGRRQKSLKFSKDTWNRFCLMELQAEYNWAHFIQGLGYVQCTKRGEPKDPQGNCAFCKVSDRDPFERFASNVLVYLTDPSGNPIGPLNERMISIQQWFFSNDKYEQIKMFKNQWGDLRAHDLLFHCTGEQYQKGTLHACPEAWWCADKEFAKIAAAKFKEERTDLSKRLVRYYEYSKQLEALNGGNQRNPQGGGQPQFNLQAVQNQVMAAGGPKPMFGTPTFGPPTAAPVAAPDLSILDGAQAAPAPDSVPDPPTSAPVAETVSGASSPSPAVPSPNAEPDTTDLDAMLESMK